jgi:hypothetical protein
MTASPLLSVSLSTLPRSGGFSGHETFTLRYAWLKKAMDALDQRPDVFSAEDAMVELGVGKNMVRSIRHWAVTCRMAEEASSGRGLQPSELGRALFLAPGWDPYTEDDGTLWLIHWQIATNMTRATTWYWAFNILREQEFTTEALTTGLERLVSHHEWTRISESTLKSDVSCFLRTYATGKRGVTSTFEDSLDCPLEA